MSESAAPIELREVQGPSSLGGGRKRFFDLLYLISVTEFKKNYFGTALGYVWSLVRPLLLFAVLLFVFTQIFRLGSRVPHYPEMLLLGIVLYSFFQEATNNSVSSVVGQEGIVRKTQFPRLVIPMSTVLTSLFNLALNLVAVLILVSALGLRPMWTWLYFPVIVLVLTVLVMSLALLLSALYVRFRDVAIIWSVGATALFYGTPILYPFQIVPDKYREIILINPLSAIFMQMRHWIIDPTAPNAVDSAGGWPVLVPAFCIYIGVCVLGVWYFRRAAPRVAEEM